MGNGDGPALRHDARQFQTVWPPRMGGKEDGGADLAARIRIVEDSPAPDPDTCPWTVGHWPPPPPAASAAASAAEPTPSGRYASAPDPSSDRQADLSAPFGGHDPPVPRRCRSGSAGRSGGVPTRPSAPSGTTSPRPAIRLARPAWSPSRGRRRFGRACLPARGGHGADDVGAGRAVLPNAQGVSQGRDGADGGTDRTGPVSRAPDLRRRRPR